MKHLLMASSLALIAAAPHAALGQTAPSDVSGAITVWSWSIGATALQNLVPAFNERYPNVTVTVEPLGNDQVYDRGLAACAAGGSGLPDVYSIENAEAEVFWARFPTCFTDLTTLGISNADADARYPAFKLRELRVDDQLFALPWDTGPVMMFYRRDLFEQTGIDVNTLATWDDYIAAGQRLLENSGGATRMATLSTGGDDEWFRMLANQAGCFYFADATDEVAINQPGCVMALETIKKLWDAGLLAEGGFDDNIQNMKGDVVATAISGGWFEGFMRYLLPEHSGKWGIAPIPALTKAGSRAANNGGSALAIPAASQHKEAAAAFVRFALEEQASAIAMLRSDGLIPAQLAALDDPFMKEPQAYWGGQAVYETILGTLAEIKPARGTQFYQEARSISAVAVTNFLNGSGGSAKAALDQAAQQISDSTGAPIAP